MEDMIEFGKKLYLAGVNVEDITGYLGQMLDYNIIGEENKETMILLRKMYQAAGEVLR